MASPAAFALLRADLGLEPGTVPSGVEALLDNDLDSAAHALLQAGIAVDETVPADLRLLVMYAAWLYRGRINSDGMPRLLEAAIKNRQTFQAVGGET